jgi:hypothetical protein
MGRNIHIRAAYRYLCQSLSLKFSFDLAGHRNASGCDWFPGSIHNLYGCISFRYAKTASPSYAQSSVASPQSAERRNPLGRARRPERSSSDGCSETIWVGVHFVRGAVHQAAFVYRFVPALRYARELIQQGAVGDVTHFRSEYLMSNYLQPGLDFSLRLDKKIAGTGTFGDLGAQLAATDSHSCISASSASACSAFKFAAEKQLRDWGLRKDLGEGLQKLVKGDLISHGEASRAQSSTRDGAGVAKTIATPSLMSSLATDYLGIVATTPHQNYRLIASPLTPQMSW